MALIIIGIAALVGVAVFRGIIEGHAENLSDPESRNFAIAFWLFLALGIWCNVDDKGIGFALFAICAVPLIILNLFWAFTK